MTRKINQEQIKIDRKLAWERVKKFLDDDDEDEDEEEEASKSGMFTCRLSQSPSSMHGLGMPGINSRDFIGHACCSVTHNSSLCSHWFSPPKCVNT